MRRWLALVGLLLAGSGAAADCLDRTDELDSMGTAAMTLEGPGNESLSLTVRVADDPMERAGGFQHVCPDVILRTAIFFEFERPRRPSFHMHNVKAPLDIAFIDENGVIVDIQRMQPYAMGATQHPYYSPPGPVAAALETRAGYFGEHRVTEGDWRIEAFPQ